MAKEEITSNSTVFLNYHNSLLRNEDVDLLRGPRWLNDAVIEFYFEYLELNHIDNNKENQDILFIGPLFTQALKLTGISSFSSDLESLLTPPRSHIFFGLNDCTSRNVAGGSHWSLLVYSTNEKTFFHLDSCTGTNKYIAQSFAKEFDNVLPSKEKSKFEELQCPQQGNGYDCGLYMLCFIDSIIQHIIKNPLIQECNFACIKNIVKNKRNELLDLIERLRNEEKATEGNT